MEDDLDIAEKMEAAVVHAMERRPDVLIPEDFAAKLVRLLPEKDPSRAVLRPVFGHIAGYIGVLVTVVVLAMLTRSYPGAIQAGQGIVFAIEMMLVVQLLAVGFWLGMKEGEPE